MRIIIGGAGRVGRHLARSIAKKHEVIVIEADEERARLLSLETDAQILRGDITRIETFRDAEVGKADIFVALTDHDETNLLACILAKEQGVPRLMARISDPGLARTFQELGIEETICPEIVASNVIEAIVSGYDVFPRILSSRSGEAKLLSATVEKGSDAEGKKLKELPVPATTAVVAIYDRESFAVPYEESALQEGQRVLFLAPARDVEKMRALFKK
ncbi:MAG: NAD-binding protein [archaeon]